MYRKQIFQKVASSLPSTPISKEIAPNPSYGSLSSVVQRVQEDPNSVSGDERQELESAIGTRSTREILAGKQTPWIPEFQGISTQIWGNAGAPIQAKLTIGEVGDKYEQEADRVAKDVVQKINTPQTNALLEADSTLIQEKLQRKHLPQIVQCQEAISGGEASTDLESAINSARGSGQPLDGGLQQSMGQAMGADFSGVRVHTDAQADQLNHSIQAKAFTTGQHVFFRQGEYQPASQGGQELIAHELTHAVQQNSAVVQKSQPVQRQTTNLMSREGEDLQPKYGVLSREQGFLQQREGCVQRKWQETNTQSLQVWDKPRTGLRWYLNTAINVMYYKIEDENQIPVFSRRHVFAMQPKQLPYKEWLGLGWGSNDDNIPDVPDPQQKRKKPNKDKELKEYEGSTVGIEIEDPAPFSLFLGPDVKRGVIATVKTNEGEVLVEFTTDMGQNPYTIENRTTPVIKQDKEGIEARKKALKLLNEVIRQAGEEGKLDKGIEDKSQQFEQCTGKAIEARKYQDMMIVIPKGTKNHKVVEKSGPTPGLQITEGISWSEMVKDADSKNGLLSEAGHAWMKEYSNYSSYFQKKYENKKVGYGVNQVFGMLASLVHFYLGRIDRSVMSRMLAQKSKNQYDNIGEEGLGGKGRIDNILQRPDLVDPKEKNAWALLPKTPPAQWLSGLNSKDQVLVKDELRKVPTNFKSVNAKAWNEILVDILRGEMIAGHAVPDFKIAKEKGFAFEIRNPRIDQQKLWLK